MKEKDLLTYAVSYSGGASSWAAARILRDRHPDHPMVLLFADTLMEDDDTYRFLEEGAQNLGLPVTRIADGRDIWQVFRDERFLGNSRVDPCSRVLKRELLGRWRDEHYTPETAEMVIGLDANEAHRLRRHQKALNKRAEDNVGGTDEIPRYWTVRAPLIEEGLFKPDVFILLKQHGLCQQRLYRLGFAHANCGGGCVKMGMTGWATLLDRMPDRYQEWEENEERMRAFLGRDVSILKDRRDGETTRLTLREFRERRQAGRLPLPKEPEWGGCGCALDGSDDDLNSADKNPP